MNPTFFQRCSCANPYDLETHDITEPDNPNGVEWWCKWHGHNEDTILPIPRKNACRVWFCGWQETARVEVDGDACSCSRDTRKKWGCGWYYLVRGEEDV